MPEELYPGPNRLKFYIPVPIIAAATIYLDIVSEGFTNPIIFFISVVVVPLIFGALAAGVTGKNFLKMFGIVGSLSATSGLVLVTVGLTLVVVFMVNIPMSIFFTGTALRNAFTLFYFPLSTMSLRTLSTLPFTFVAIYYLTIGFGEEWIKFYGQSVVGDWLYTRVRSPRLVAIFLGTIISWIGWLLIHAVANPAIVTLPGMMMGLSLSFLWVAPMWVFFEPLIDPAKGINFTVFCIFGTAMGHAVFDILIEMFNMGTITPAHTTLGLVGGVASIVAGLGLLAYDYWKKSLPIFGFIKY